MSPRITFFTLSASLLLFACGGGGSSSSNTSSSAGSDAGDSAKNSQLQADAATISGSVKFSGQKPKAKKVSMSADAYCKGQHTKDVWAEDVVVNPNGTLKNVLVYVKSGLSGGGSGPTPVLDQIGCIYTPHVMAVQAGQEFTIRNSDSVMHNVNARPKNNRGFNIGQPVKGMETKKKFDKPEIAIPLKCDVHPWMRSYVAVLPHGFSNVTDNTGKFSIKLPPGTYEIEAWHETFGTTTQSVTVGAKESKSISFTLKGA